MNRDLLCLGARIRSGIRRGAVVARGARCIDAVTSGQDSVLGFLPDGVWRAASDSLGSPPYAKVRELRMRDCMSSVPDSDASAVMASTSSWLRVIAAAARL